MRIGLKNAVTAAGAVACALLAADAAIAACVSDGAVLTCDAAAPNPERGGALATNIRLLNGAIIQRDDPYAFAGLRAETIGLGQNGTLTADAGSQVYDTAAGGTAVARGAPGGKVRTYLGAELRFP